MEFEKRIWETIKICEEKFDYKPTIFINMVYEHGMVDAVKRLINTSKPSSGYTKLWELNALNLSLEAIILEDEWKNIFTEEERMKAKKRLKEYGYNV